MYYCVDVDCVGHFLNERTLNLDAHRAVRCL